MKEGEQREEMVGGRDRRLRPEELVTVPDYIKGDYAGGRKERWWKGGREGREEGANAQGKSIINNKIAVRRQTHLAAKMAQFEI